MAVSKYSHDKRNFNRYSLFPPFPTVCRNICGKIYRHTYAIYIISLFDLAVQMTTVEHTTHLLVQNP